MPTNLLSPTEALASSVTPSSSHGLTSLPSPAPPSDISKYKQQKREEKCLASFRDLCTVFAAVSVFLASLGATFLQYVQSAIFARPEGSPGKGTDVAANSLLFISIFLSIGTTLCLGYGAAFSLVDHASTMRTGYADLVRMAWGVVFGLTFTMFKFDNSISGERKKAAKVLASVGRPQHDESGRTPVLNTNNINSDHVAISDLVRQSATFLVTILLLLCISVITLLVGLLVFAWAEQPRVVSILVTVVVVIVAGFIFVPIVVTGEITHFSARQGITDIRGNTLHTNS